MTEKTENKVTRAYSLSPAVTAWILKKAQQRVVESNGEKRLNESEVTNDILTAAMEEDARNEKQKKSLSVAFGATKAKRNDRVTA